MALKNPGVIGNNYSAWVEELRKAKKIFDSAGVKYWLDMGTILGAMRNGEMIPWDNDIDFSAEITEVPKVISVIPEFTKRGYQVIVTDAEIYFNTPEHISIGMAFYRVTNDKIWIIWLETHSKLKFITRHLKRVAERMLYRDYHYGLHKIEERFYKSLPNTWLQPMRKLFWKMCYLSGSRNYVMVFPKRMVDDLETIKLCGLEFKVPSPAKEYIQLIYGPNWQIPDKNWRWDQVEAIDYNFFDQKNRTNFNLLEYLPVEDKIIRLFNTQGDALVASEVADSDFIWRAVFSKIGQFNPLTKKILEVGSGKGKYVSKLQSLGFNITGIEPAEELVKISQELYPEAEFVVGTATKIPYADNTVDCIICIEVLEHIPDTEKAIREMHRVLKPTGRLIIIDKNIRSWHYLYFIPTLIWKYIKERLNQWMYPANFGFQEKYFVPSKLSKLLQKYFQDDSTEYLRYYPVTKSRSLGKRIIWWIHEKMAKIMYRLFPRASFYVLWQGTK